MRDSGNYLPPKIEIMKWEIDFLSEVYRTFYEEHLSISWTNVQNTSTMLCSHVVRTLSVSLRFTSSTHLSPIITWGNSPGCLVLTEPLQPSYFFLFPARFPSDKTLYIPKVLYVHICPGLVCSLWQLSRPPGKGWAAPPHVGGRRASVKPPDQKTQKHKNHKQTKNGSAIYRKRGLSSHRQ